MQHTYRRGHLVIHNLHICWHELRVSAPNMSKAYRSFNHLSYRKVNSKDRSDFREIRRRAQFRAQHFDQKPEIQIINKSSKPARNKETTQAKT